ncbi:unnamed protein product [Rotaria magnacalcarata]|uniref:Uncharacterized protein n=1 Tax=Rotaria magnacalcarata TaxID=392030 RepID=A0A819YRH5_9BILA|nr:unnamed protein product [Rotaria magnacalcarata]CAF1637654.1 unnamed protein product [Rotaria magnacalcarata]CAF2040794.1 unnamed protein product [Rotaria magnacalcarata]CAF4158759.1 unnamed protein product [Rotaria magnacalcarata]CAF4207808.1 unnamed protein product [Rotaria magnacalcarata]
MYEVEEIEEHLAPISGVGINSISDESDFADDLSVEITSNVDENENELIKWTNYLQLNSDSDEDNDQDYPSIQSATLLQCSSLEASSDNENISQSSPQLESTNNQNHICANNAWTSFIVHIFGVHFLIILWDCRADRTITFSSVL